MHTDKLDPIGHSINLERTRSMHPQIKHGYLARVKVMNQSETIEQFGQIIRTLEQVNKQESQFKYIRND